eukprot:m.64622 g.64622  ORF g.64622 m.64622 type:complete len:346 (+) comp13934_c0_seq1:229-1266(+)
MQTWVYAHPSMRSMAENLRRELRSRRFLRLKKVEDDFRVKRIKSQISPEDQAAHDLIDARLDDIRWNSFEDGFPNIFIENVKDMAGKDVIFLASFHTTSVIFDQLAVIYALPRYLAKSLTIILPYFPTGTMERIDSEGQIASAMTMATMLSHVPLSSKGPATIMVFDIHALQERFYFGPQVIPRLESAMPLLQEELSKLDKSKVTVAFPDDGAFKRFHNFFTEYDILICNKIREGDKRIVKIKEGDAHGRHVVIVDDLIKTGGTILECANTVKAAGAAEINVFVTHAVFPQGSWKKVIDSPISKFWVTDSVPTIADEIRDVRPFVVFQLAGVIADRLLDFDLMNS